jgi:gliding motility-associated-like protein
LFSPNGDGANDNFKVRGGEGAIEKISLKIVDRNNNPMYDSSNLRDITEVGWDGKKDGKDQPAGTYMWYIEGTYKDGKPLEFNGKKTGLIRLMR